MSIRHLSIFFISVPGSITAYVEMFVASSLISLTVPITMPLGMVPLIPAVVIIEPYVIFVAESRFSNLQLPFSASFASPVT